MKLNESIKYYRTEIGMSQSELAKKTYTTKSSVSKWESGLITPNIDMVKIIAKALDIKFYQLIGEKENVVKRVINIIGKIMLYLFAWIHIDVTLGVTVSAFSFAWGLVGIIGGVGGSIALTVLYSIYDAWTPLAGGFVAVILIATPFFFVTFGAISYLLFIVAKNIYHLSLKYFWGVRNNLDKLAIKPNKKIIKWLLISALVTGIVFAIYVGSAIGASHGDWTAMIPNLKN